MKNIIRLLTFVCMVSFAFVSCKSEFDEINIDPNNPAEPNTALLMSNSIRHLGSQTSGIAGWAKDIYPQYMSERQYTNESRFQNKIYDYYPYYNGPLLDLQTIINLNTDPETAGLSYVQAGGSNANQLAAARILRAFYYLHMTDRWGRIPYSEALQGMDDLTPKFDAQEEIYADIFNELKEAVAQFDNGSINGDILFEGDTDQWIKWANTLRMVAAIHLSNVDENTARDEFRAAASQSIISGNGDNVYFRYLSDANNQNPIYENYFVSSRVDYAVSETMIGVLKDLEDPRLAIYADTTRTGEYVGMPYALENPGASYTKESVSLIGSKFTAQNYALPITTYAQVQFMMAEAAFRGWIDGDVAAFYQNGITASLTQHLPAKGLQEAIDEYLDQPEIAYSAANGLEQIIIQKWIANYQANGYESWVDWRRTGFPTLDPGPKPLSIDGEIPRRQAYTNQEIGLNRLNYLDALAEQGPDEVNTRVWWDVD